MTEKIDELKKLIETLAEDSPLRKQLQEALEAEMKRTEDEAEKNADQTAEKAEESTSDTEKKEEEPNITLDDLKKLNERLEEQLKEMEEANPSTITGKLEKLMEDDEFITASAGFVLGAAVTGISALAISLLRK